jgi:hypothetical protein
MGPRSIHTAFKAIRRMDLRNASVIGNPLAMWKFECTPRAVRNENMTKMRIWLSWLATGQMRVLLQGVGR